ncbi:ERVV2 protein, partial [Crotophaga sulcirostris]|nr:ERVV2 protein [Crotophaga sulcirostris]
LAKEGGLCTIINQTCCIYINQENRIETDLQKIWERNKIFHQVTDDDTSFGFTDLWEKLTSWLPNLSWLKQLFLTFVIIVVLLVALCVLIRWALWCCQNTGIFTTVLNKH